MRDQTVVKKCLIISTFWFLVSCGKLPVNTSFVDGCWNIDVMTLGEYTLMLGSVEVKNVNKEVVWSIQPRGDDVVRIGKFVLCDGKNEITAQTRLSIEKLKVYPENVSHFMLEGGRYELVISSPEYNNSRSVWIEF